MKTDQGKEDLSDPRIIRIWLHRKWQSHLFGFGVIFSTVFGLHSINNSWATENGIDVSAHQYIYLHDTGKKKF